MAIVFAASAAGAQTIGAQLIDRILAVVAGNPITLSDVTAAVRFGLVPAPGAGEAVEQAVLEALIDRSLQLIEVNRYLPPEPADAEIASRLAVVQSRFAGEAAFDAALNETGVDRAQLRARIRDTIRIETYVRQRFGSAFEASDDDVVRYYRTHPSEFTRDGALRPYADVKDEARQKLLDERSTTLMRGWLAGLRRRADVTILNR